MCTPPSKDGKINPGALVAADLAGVQEIYKLSVRRRLQPWRMARKRAKSIKNYRTRAARGSWLLKLW